MHSPRVSRLGDLRQPEVVLSALRLLAFLVFAAGDGALPFSVRLFALAYVVVATALSQIGRFWPHLRFPVLTGVVAADSAWFMGALLYFGPLNSLPAILYAAVVAALTAIASPQVGVAVGLLTALVYYAFSVACHGSALHAVERHLLAYQAATIALAGVLSGYISTQWTRLRQTVQTARRLERLNQAASEMVQARDNAGVVRCTMAHAADLLGASRAWVMLADAATRTLTLDGHMGASPPADVPTEATYDDGVAGGVMKNRAPIMINGSANRHSGVSRLEQAFAEDHLLAVPIAHTEGVVGALLVSKAGPRPFTDSDQAALTMLARCAGSAVQTARLIRSLHIAATTDSLTGLQNHATFLRALADRLRQARSAASPVSLIVLDLDQFKRVNDAAGHWVGDQVLSALADTLRQHCRGSDTIGRCGGDEFAVILPGTGPEEAAAIARRAADALRHAAARLDARVPVTASWGVSSSPWDGSTDEELFRRADERLYEAKEAGGDRVAFESIVA